MLPSKISRTKTINTRSKRTPLETNDECLSEREDSPAPEIQEINNVEVINQEKPKQVELQDPLTALEEIERLVEQATSPQVLTLKDKEQLKKATSLMRTFFKTSLRQTVPQTMPQQTNEPNKQKQRIMQTYAQVTKQKENTIIIKPIDAKHTETVKLNLQKVEIKDTTAINSFSST